MTENAPDGGPGSRRPTGDPLVQLTVEISEQRRDHQRLRDQHVQLASDLSEMGATVSGVRDQVSSLASALNQLATTVAGEQDADEDDPRPDPVDWWLLDRAQAKDAWDGLWRWVAGYLVPTFALTRDELVDCWPRHAALRDLLSSMWVTQRAATARSARKTADAEWQVRYRPDGLSMLTTLTSKLGCTAGKCSLVGASGVMPKDNEPTGPELWHAEGVENDLAHRPEPEDTST